MSAAGKLYESAVTKRLSCAAFAAVVLAPVASAAPVALHVTASDTHPGAQRVALKLRFDGELQCGTVAGHSLKVTLPAAAQIPSSVAPRALLVNGQQAGSIVVRRNVITVTPKHPPDLCDIVTGGAIRITFTRRAGLGNPVKAGTYPIVVAQGAALARGRLIVR